VSLEFKPSFDRFNLKIDKALLKQVLDNLLSNAVKFTEKGSIALVCEIDEENGKVRFIVEDTGCGIPEEKQNKIFESFEKVDSFVQGIGLGLTICKLVAGRVGGAIELDKTYKKGTRMIFTHPIIKNN
jgi:signal transduction histidine kinase